METIIIESNRQISLKNELNSLAKTQVNEGFIPASNSEWRTDIRGDIQIKVGDEIQVETCSIQTLGSPDQEIEFSGKENVSNAFDLVDNVGDMDIGFYITNRMQFNANLPLKDMEVHNTDNLAQGLNYFLPDLSNFDKFRQAYPYRGMEGFSKDGNNYNVISYGLFTKPPSDLMEANSFRLTLGDQEFKGFNTASGDVNPWNEKTSSVSLNVGTGFKTPSAVGEKITAQFHNIDNIEPNSSIGVDFDDPRVYFTENNALFSTDISGITDKTYKSIVTSTGDIFKAYQFGNWSARLPDTGGTEGDNYQESQGEALLYRNLLVGNPDEWKSVGNMMATRLNTFSEQNLPTDYEQVGNYTGNANYNVFNVGQFGVFHCLLDELDIQTSSGTYYYPTGRTTQDQVDNITYCNIPAGQLIVTNTIYNLLNLNRLQQFLVLNRVADDNDNLTPQTPDTELWKYYSTELKFGRTDDYNSLGANGHKVMAPLIPKVVSSLDFVQNSYQIADGNYRLVGFTNDGRSTTRHSTELVTHWNDSLIDTATFPTNTDFTLTNSKGNKFSTALSKQLNIAVVPVFKKTATGTLIDVPFCAYVNRKGTFQLPYIMKGEYLGSSPSFMDNQVAKIVTTQKPDNADKTYPTGTDPQDYMNVVYIGAQNPTLKFDDTVSKFSFTDFHTPVYGSNGTYQEPLDSTAPNSAVDEESMCVNCKEAMICTTDVSNNGLRYNLVAQSNEPYLVSSAQSGITIKTIFSVNKSSGSTIELNNELPLQFTGTFYDKLGFELEQLLPYAGNRQLQFNRSNYNDAIGFTKSIFTKTQNMVSPFTTNAYISGSNQLSLSGLPNGLTANLLGTQNDLQPIFINADSDELIATNPAQKLDYPYLTISSNIVPSTLYYSPSGVKIPAMAYVNRSFTQGDYFFGQTQSWVYTVDKDYNISSVTTKITLPNGEPAPIDGNSSVIYKITRAKTLPPPPEEIKNK